MEVNESSMKASLQAVLGGGGLEYRRDLNHERLERRNGLRSESLCISLRFSCLLRCSIWACGCLQKAFGVEAAEALVGQLLPETVKGCGGCLVDSLLGDAQPLTDLGLAVAFYDEGEDLPGEWRQ